MLGCSSAVVAASVNLLDSSGFSDLSSGGPRPINFG